MSLLETDGRRLHALLVRLTLRHDAAEDLLQDLTVRLAESDSFAAAAYPYAFARTAAVNLALDWRRRTLSRRQRELAHVPAERESSPLLALERAELIDRMLDELEHLSVQDRDLVAMRFMDAMEYDAIGQAIGKTGQQARGLCYHAVRRLRERVRRVMGKEGESASAGIGGLP